MRDGLALRLVLLRQLRLYCYKSSGALRVIPHTAIGIDSNPPHSVNGIMIDLFAIC